MSGRFVSRRSFALGSLAAAALTVMPAPRTQYGAVSASAADVRLPGPHKLLQSRLVRTPGYGAASLFWPREPQARCPVVVTFPGYTGSAEEMHTIAKRLATHGCAVLAAGSIEPKAFPDSRAKQMLAALDDARGRGEWASVIDPAKPPLSDTPWAAEGRSSLRSEKKCPPLSPSTRGRSAASAQSHRRCSLWAAAMTRSHP